MSRVFLSALVTSTLPVRCRHSPNHCGSTPQSYADGTAAPTLVAAARSNMGGGFFEFLFSGGERALALRTELSRRALRRARADTAAINGSEIPAANRRL